MDTESYSGTSKAPDPPSDISITDNPRGGSYVAHTLSKQAPDPSRDGLQPDRDCSAKQPRFMLLYSSFEGTEQEVDISEAFSREEMKDAPVSEHVLVH